MNSKLTSLNLRNRRAWTDCKFPGVCRVHGMRCITANRLEQTFVKSRVIDGNVTSRTVRPR